MRPWTRASGPCTRRSHRHPPDAATLDARVTLATVIVLDQFSRNLHRGTAAAFATDVPALARARAAVDAGLDSSMRRVERQFLYMPFMHAEDLAEQERSLQLFEALGDRDALRSARRHHDQIVRFGRFPARNAALGRASTADEVAWLTRSVAGARRICRLHRAAP